jgi:uncharacterized protein
MANPLRINATELLRRPGTERDVDVVVEVQELAIDDPRLDPDAPVHVRLRLEALSDGVVVSGTLTSRWHDVCRRCAEPAGGELVTKVDELYQETVTDPDAFELQGAQLDLAPMVREALLLDVPAAPLCRPDCAGLCPSCGADLNTSTCDCAPAPADHRWSALDAWQGEA